MKTLLVCLMLFCAYDATAQSTPPGRPTGTDLKNPRTVGSGARSGRPSDFTFEDVYRCEWKKKAEGSEELLRQNYPCDKMPDGKKCRDQEKFACVGSVVCKMTEWALKETEHLENVKDPEFLRTDWHKTTQCASADEKSCKSGMDCELEEQVRGPYDANSQYLKVRRAIQQNQRKRGAR